MQDQWALCGARAQGALMVRLTITVVHAETAVLSTNLSWWVLAYPGTPEPERYSLSVGKPKLLHIPHLTPQHTLAPVLPSLGLCLGARGYCSQRIRV